MQRVLLPTIEAPGYRGGVARYIAAIVDTLGKHVDVVALPNLRYWSIGSLLWKRRHAYDQVWVHHILPVGSVVWLFKILGAKPYVIFLHGMDFDLARQGALRRWLAKRILRGAKRVVANSVALAKEVAAFARVAEPLTVYPCVSDELIGASNVIPSREGKVWTTLLTVSRLVERKGHLKVLEAIKDMPHAAYEIVGDGPMRATIAARIVELGLADRVRIHPDVTDAALAEFYRAADIFAMPASKSTTDREGFGIVYLEASLFALPVIACRTPGVDEAVIDDKTGVLVDDSVEAIKNAVVRLSADRPFSVTLGKQGRERVLAEFTREKQFAKLRQLL